MSRLARTFGLTGRGRRRSRRFLLTLLMLAVPLVALSLSTAWLLNQGIQIRNSLEAVRDALPLLQTQLAEKDSQAAQMTLASMQEDSERARSGVSDPLWKAATHAPLVGPNFSAVSELSVTADDVVDRALVPLLSAYDAMVWENLAPVNGVVDIEQIESVSPRLSTAANTVSLSHERLASIDPDGLIEFIATPLTEATSTLGEASVALDGAAAAAQVVPRMLGAQEPRNYLILVQNSSEVRATGGIPGALAVVSADQGRLDLIAQESASSMGTL